MQTEHNDGLIERTADTTQNTTRPGDLPHDSHLDLQDIATETERYLAAADEAINSVLEKSGDNLTFLQSMRQESGQ